MMINHSNDYFNELRNKGIEVIQEDTCWIDAFCKHVVENNLISEDKLKRTLERTIEVLEPGQTSKDAIALLRKFDIDYKPIDEKYENLMVKWKEIFTKN